MMRDLTCPACHGTVAWKVDPVRENEGVEMAVWWDAEGRPVGRFALWVCEACGLCEWWAAGLVSEAQPAEDEGAFPRERSCVVCASRDILVVPMRDAVVGGSVPMRVIPGAGTSGRLHTFVCRACGHSRWVVAGLERALLEDDARFEPGGTACVSCRSGLVWQTSSCDALVRPSRRSDEPIPPQTSFQTRQLLPVLGDPATPRLLLCLDCAAVSWFVDGLVGNAPDLAAGVQRLAAPRLR